jgi:hypothetical protein
MRRQAQRVVTNAETSSTRGNERRSRRQAQRVDGAETSSTRRILNTE